MNLDKFKEFMNADWKQLAVEQWGNISSICNLTTSSICTVRMIIDGQLACCLGFRWLEVY